MNDKIKILHLEDESADAGFVARELKKGKINAEILVVNKKAKFVSALNDFIPDIILCDNSIPSFNAHQALGLVKEMNVSIPFLLVTATMTEEYAVEIMREGADDYLFKDRLHRLPEAVTAALEKGQLKKKQHETEQLFRVLIENGSDIITLRTAEGKLFYASPSASHIIGYTSEELLKSHAYDLIHPDDLPGLLEQIILIFKTPRASFFRQQRYHHKNGSYIWCEGTVTNMLHEPGVNALVSNFRDISERKKAEEAIRASELRYRRLFEAAKDGILILHAETGVIEDVNPFLEKKLGFSHAEFTGKQLWELGFFKDIDENKAAFVKLKKEGIIRYEDLPLKTKTGQSFWVEFVSNVYDVGGKSVIQCNIRDITERKKAEKALIESEKEVRAIAESMPQIVWVTTADGKNTYFNQQWVDYTGLTQEESRGDGWLIPFHKDDKPLARTAWNNAVNSLAEYSVECRLRKHDGSYHWWLIRGVPAINEKGELEKWYGTCTDIEKIKQTEVQLRNSEVFNRGVLNSLSSHIAVVNEEGTIVAVNESWKQFALDNGETSLERTAEGSNYFTVCEKSAAMGDDVAAYALKGMKEVMDGTRIDFYLEYPCHSPNKKRWFGMRALKFDSNEPMIVVAHMSITERKLAEEALIVTSNKLQHTLSDLTKIMDSSLDVICTVDAKGNFLKVSAASEAVWGYKPEELIGKPLLNFVYHEDNEKTQLTAANVMTGNNLNHFENRYVRKDGSLVPIEWSARWDKKDQIRYGIARDVTEKKRLERAFEIERQQFFDLFSEAPSSMGVLSGPEHRFEMANPPYLQLIGKKDIIGKSVKDILPEMVDQGFIDILDQVYQTGETYSANEMLIKLDIQNDGILVDRYLNFLYQPHKGRDGKTDGIFFFAVDVSEQVVSRKKIEESETQLKEAQAIGHIGNWEIDMVNNIHTWSDEFYRIYGINRDEVQPSSELFLSFMHPDDAEYTQRKVQETFDTVKGSNMNFRFIKKDGSIRHGYAEWKFELDATKKPLRLYGIVQDITEIKEAELKLANTLLELEHRVEERTKELSDKNKNITDSINYAKRIQVGLLTPYSELAELFPNSFIISEPQNIVSGDFFWCYQKNNKKFVVVADCTGHGVPGALMSIIGNNLLNGIIVDEHIDNPSEILQLIDTRLKEAMKGDKGEIKDGMDIALCVIDTYFKELYFAGAYRPLFVSDDNGLISELEGTPCSIGGGMGEVSKKFETKRFPIIPGQRIYLTSDGYYSQFGGPLGKKFMKKYFRETLEEIQAFPIAEHKNKLRQVLAEWAGRQEQVDDVMVVGIEL